MADCSILSPSTSSSCTPVLHISFSLHFSDIPLTILLFGPVMLLLHITFLYSADLFMMRGGIACLVWVWNVTYQHSALAKTPVNDLCNVTNKHIWFDSRINRSIFIFFSAVNLRMITSSLKSVVSLNILAIGIAWWGQMGTRKNKSKVKRSCNSMLTN